MASSSESSAAGVFVLGTAAPGSAVAAFLDATQLTLQHVQFACGGEVESAGPSAPLGVALVVSGPGPVAAPALAAISQRLAPNATLYLYEQDAAQIDAAQKALVLGGFLDPQAVPSHPQLVRARKPEWEVGAKAALRLKRPAPAPVANAWQLASDADDLVDEDELLTEADKAAKPVVAAGDCSTSRKACKDCTCGRAEAEAADQKVTLTQDMLDNPKTNCGSCALGDAFRCAGCPYRGLPAFEPGKKITLGADFLTADA